MSNIVVTPNIEGTQANITWSMAQLFDANTVVVYTVLVRDVNGTIVLNGSTANLIIPVNGLSKLNFAQNSKRIDILYAVTVQ